MTPRVGSFKERQRSSAPLAVIISMVTTVRWRNAFLTVFVNAPAFNGPNALEVGFWQLRSNWQS
jgi:hypothetical protein